MSRPRQPSPGATIDTGAAQLYAELTERSKAADAPGMIRAFQAWYERLWAHANQEGPEGDAFMDYLACLLMVWTDNQPDLPPSDAVVWQLVPRICSRRRDARAYAKHLKGLIQARRAAGLAIAPAHLEISEAATRAATGRGRGDDPDIYYGPARDFALLCAYEAGTIAADLATPDARAHAFADHLPSWARPADDSDRYQDTPAVYRQLSRARHRRDISRLAFMELSAIAEYLPDLSPVPLV